MGESVFGAVRDITHLALHFWDLTGSTECHKCPDCVCPLCKPILQEKVPEALTQALAFAQVQCSVTTSTTTLLSVQGWSFSLFWLGFALGIFVATVVLCSCAVCLRCFRGASTSVTSPTLPPVGGVSRQLSLSEGEPVNPRTLRQLGLVQ